MSGGSETSSKREKAVADLAQEIDGVRAMNSSLRTYLTTLRTFKRQLIAVDANFQQLRQLNQDLTALKN